MRTTVILAVLLGAAALASAQDRLADQLRKGIVLEETDQNLDKAIQAYQAVVAQFDEDRKTAATALFRLAECYRKTGKREQAVAAYQRVIGEFADQKALVESSRRQLADAFGVTESRPAARASTEVVQLRRELADVQKALQAAQEKGVAAGSPLPATTAPETPEAARFQIALLEERLAEARRMHDKGLLPTSDVRELELQLVMAREQYQQALKQRQTAEQAAQEARVLNEATLKSVEAEIALVEQQVKAIEQKVAAGVVSPQASELLQLRRDLLGLQRKADEIRAALNVSKR